MCHGGDRELPLPGSLSAEAVTPFWVLRAICSVLLSLIFQESDPLTSLRTLLLFSHLVASDSLQIQTAAHQASLSGTVSWSLLKFISIESVMPSNHLILWGHLLLLPSIFPSTKVFSNELALHIRRPKYWSFSFSTSPSNEYSGLISFKIDRFDLLAVQGTLKSLL